MSYCSLQYYMHSLQPPTDLDSVVPPIHPSSSLTVVVPPSLSQTSAPALSGTMTTMGLPPAASSISAISPTLSQTSAPAPSWTMTTMGLPSTGSWFQQWGLDSSADSTATVNDCCIAVIQCHQPALYKP